MSRGKLHELKIWPEPFRCVEAGWLTGCPRKNDREFEVGDVLALHEYQPDTEKYTGRVCFRRITYILQGGQFGIDKDYVVLSLSPQV